MEVLPLAGGSRLREALVYKAPPGVDTPLRVGHLVRIPLRNRYELGVVSREGTDQVVPGIRIKHIQEVLNSRPALTEDLLSLARWMQDYYAVSMESVLETMIPGPVRRGVRPQVKHYLSRSDKVMKEADREKLQRRAPRQYEVLAFLEMQTRSVDRSVLQTRIKVGSGSINRLIEAGWLVEETQLQSREVYRDLFGSNEQIGAQRFELTDDQAQALRRIRGSLEHSAFQVRLLHGVTGSGKTEVYLQAMEQVLNRGGGVLFLVPEVALAPQTVGRLRARLEKDGIQTVVWHSLLSEGERFDAWQALVNREARVVVGARSAVFAPIPDLQLIIVDEEHEPAYKQEETPRYHGRDVAVYRAKLCNAVCILGSATPSLETLYNAYRGRYALDVMPRRIDDRKLPTMHVVDMREEFIRNREKNKGPVVFSRMLVELMRDRLERKEQTILFLNRRGFATSLLCMECGWVAESPNSSVTLTFHQSDNTLKCHLSGHTEPAPMRCPSCGSTALRKRGTGTQRIESVVRALFPQARVVRMDADVMTKKNLFRKILSDFRLGHIDILIGTQMIAKGLDFPNVTLVGLVDADVSMHLPDFRAAERTFQLMVQVAGRAGRGDGHGEVVIQTFNPHSGPILFARQGDFEGFLEEELAQRQEYHYPPFRHLIRHIIRGKNPEKVAFFSEHFAREAEQALGELAEIRGPSPAPLEKVKENYRFHLWYFVKSVTKVVPLLDQLRKDFKWDPDVEEVLDVDPMNLL